MSRADDLTSPELQRMPMTGRPGEIPDPPGSPWHTETSREVYRNPWITVTEYGVTRPDGTQGIYGVVDPRDNVTIVAVTEQEQVYLVEDFLYPIGARIWLLPSGAVDPDEPPADAARRELAEETGLTASEWNLLGVYYLSPGISPQRTYLYLARGLTEGHHQREGTEAAMSVRLAPLREAYGTCLRGDGQVAAAALGLWLAWAALHPDAPTQPADS